MRRVWSRVKVLLPQHPRDLEADETVTDTTVTETATVSASENADVTPTATPSVPPVPTTTEPGGAPAPDEAPEAPDSTPDAAPSPDAPAEPAEPTTAPEPAEGDSAEAKARRGRGELEADVKTICDQYVTGGLVLPEGDHLTAHKIANNIKALHTLTEPPSSGAVTAVLERWKEIGYADLNDKPKAFKDYTDAGRTEGLTALKAKAAEEKRANRAATKLAAKSAAPAPAETAPADSAPATEGSEPF